VVLSHSHYAGIHIFLDILNHGLFNAAAKRRVYTSGWKLATNKLEKDVKKRIGRGLF
jgi:hypothetical protein